MKALWIGHGASQFLSIAAILPSRNNPGLYDAYYQGNYIGRYTRILAKTEIERRLQQDTQSQPDIAGEQDTLL